MLFFKMPKMTIGNRTVPLPIIQGGMGVGVSNFAASGAEGQQQPALFSLDAP